jgi:hypothetical protein
VSNLQWEKLFQRAPEKRGCALMLPYARPIFLRPPPPSVLQWPDTSVRLELVPLIIDFFPACFFHNSKKVFILDGGLKKWKLENKKTFNQLETFNRTKYLAEENTSLVKNKLQIDLTGLVNKEIPFDTYTKYSNEFEFQLPLSKNTVTFKIMSGGDEKVLESEMKGLAKFANKKGPGKNLTTRLKHQIIALDGNRDTKAIRDFIENELMARDSLDLRKTIKASGPDVSMQFRFECDQCAHDEVVDLPIDSGFFWPNTKS